METKLFPTKVTRDLRISSPQPLYRALQDFLEQYGFQVYPKQPPELRPGALSGTANFFGQLYAIRDSELKVSGRNKSIGIVTIGIILIIAMFGLIQSALLSDLLLPILGFLVGSILIITGAGQFRSNHRTIRHIVNIYLEGESYQAGATRGTKLPFKATGMDLRVERSGIISDARITTYTGIGYAEGWETVSAWLAEELDLFGDSASDGKENGFILQHGKGQASSENSVLPVRLEDQIEVIINQFELMDP